ncbi:MAG: hypothetical protein ACP5C3_04100 [Methanomicrobiales archaeon]
MDKKNVIILAVVIAIIVIVSALAYTTMNTNMNQSKPTNNTSDTNYSIQNNQQKTSTVNGTRKICYYCGGAGWVECFCGNGRIECFTCEGDGRLDDGSICSVCKGKGTLICPDCKGTGKLICPSCGGDGYIDPGDQGNYPQ